NGFYKHDIQYYNKKTEDEVFTTLLHNEKYKKILLEKNYHHFGASYKNKHWILIFRRLYAKGKIDIKLLLTLTNKERTKIGLKKLILNTKLVDAVQKYVEYLSRNKIYDHIPDVQKKLTGMTWGENLGHSYETEEEA
ncbi:1182_t:CDS:2, partial [Cetraspora pellucida]